MTDLLSEPTSPTCPATARYPAVEAVLACWDRLRAGRPMPDRDDIDPREIAQALEFLFVAEPVAPGVARLRLAGQHMTQLLGMEPRGMPLSALFAGPARDELAQAVGQVSGHGLRALLPVRAEGGLGRPALEGLLALMPLGGAGAREGRILGVLQTRGAIGRVPRRLLLSGPVERLAPPAAPLPPPGRPRLRVIAGGRS